MITNKTKTCTKCGKSKSIETDFYHQNDKPNAACKNCNLQRAKAFRDKHIERDRATKRVYRTLNEEKVAKDSKKWRKLNEDKLNEDKALWRKGNPKKIRKYNLMSKFGINEQQYLSILDFQFSCCAICQRNRNEFKKDFAVDHDHITGKIRGLLCMPCNVAIGSLKDSIDLLQKAIKYLEAQGGYISHIVQKS